MKKLFLLLLGLLIIFYMSSCEDNTKVYTIELTYCDSAKPKERLRVRSIFTPHVETYKQAVPVYTTTEKTYVNICDLTVLKIEEE